MFKAISTLLALLMVVTPCLGSLAYAPLSSAVPSAPNTDALMFAHESLGRAVADMHREPFGQKDTQMRKAAKKLAVRRANIAFARMGLPLRDRYWK